MSYLSPSLIRIQQVFFHLHSIDFKKCQSSLTYANSIWFCVSLFLYQKEFLIPYLHFIAFAICHSSRFWITDESASLSIIFHNFRVSLLPASVIEESESSSSLHFNFFHQSLQLLIIPLDLKMTLDCFFSSWKMKFEVIVNASFILLLVSILLLPTIFAKAARFGSLKISSELDNSWTIIQSKFKAKFGITFNLMRSSFFKFWLNLINWFY